MEGKSTDDGWQRLAVWRTYTSKPSTARSGEQGVINGKVKLFRAKWHFSTWHNCSGGSGIKIGEGWCGVMKFVCREWQMSPTMSPSKSDKNQPSKYIILAGEGYELEPGTGSSTSCLTNLPLEKKRRHDKILRTPWFLPSLCAAGTHSRCVFLLS